MPPRRGMLFGVKIPKLWGFQLNLRNTIAQNRHTATLERVEVSQCAWILAWWDVMRGYVESMFEFAHSAPWFIRVASRD